jgi:hypothetical protein
MVYQMHKLKKMSKAKARFAIHYLYILRGYLQEMTAKRYSGRALMVMHEPSLEYQ